MRPFSHTAVFRLAVAVAAASVASLLGLAADANSLTGTWTAAGEFASARGGAATVLLFDGRVLVTGGSDADRVLRSAAVFTAEAGFSAGTPMLVARSGHAAVALFDGRVLVAGGRGSDGLAMNSAEIYDPWAGQWHQVPAMSEARSGHTATLLDDGRVLIAGGDVAGVPSATFEVFDPTVDAFAPAGVLSAPRTRHAAALLDDGRVLIAGGTDGNVPLASMDLVDADRGWTGQAMMAEARAGLSATTLLDRKVFLAGGTGANGDLASTELFDPATAAVTAGPALAQARSGHVAFLLPNNNAVVLAGGSAAGASLASTELFYPWDHATFATGALATPKSGASGTPLAVPGQLMVAASAESQLAETYHFATVVTDRQDYSPGETVTITGSGWQPGETVTLLLREDPDVDEHQPMTAVADASGNFVNADFMPDEHDLDVRFYLTAKASASEAQTTFTDATNASDGDGEMSVNPAQVSAGSTTTLVFTFDAGNRDFPANSQVKLQIPTGWPAPKLNGGGQGAVSVANLSCTSVSPPVITGNAVTVTVACPSKKQFTLTYSSVTAPLTAQDYTFTTQTRVTANFVTITSGQKDGSPVVTVNPTCSAAAVTTQPSNQSITYGASAAFTAAASGNPTPAVQWQVSTNGTFTDVPGATSPTLNVTSPAVSASGSQYRAVFTNTCNGTKTATSNAATLTVNPRPVTVTADAKTKSYGDTDPALTYQITSGTLFDTDTFSGAISRIAGESVGSYAIQRGTLSLGANYNLSFVEANLTITARPVTVTADAKTKTYGDADPTLTYQVTSGTLAAGDAFTGSPARAAGEDVGAYPIGKGTLSLGTNYSVSFVGANLTITARSVTVTADPKAKIYGDADPAFTYDVTAGSLASGDSFTGSLARVAGESVGTFPIGQGTLALSTNYVLTFVGANLSITPRPVTVTADAQSRVYGDGDPALTYKVTNGSVVNGDSFSGNLSRTAGENVGSYAIEQGTLALNGNYNLSYVGADLTITARPVAVTAGAKTKVYGDSDPALTYTVSSGSLVNGDAFTGALNRDAGENVGSYAIRQGTLALPDNYNLSYAGADLTISARPVTATADAKDKTYGEADPTLTYQITSGTLAAGDSVTGSLARVAGENIGAYAIQQATLALSANYDLTFVGADLTISPRPVTVTADARSKTYGDSDPALTYQLTSGSLIGADGFGGALSRAEGESVGQYVIGQGTLALSTNYALTFVSAHLTITARPLTVAADPKTKVYGQADPELTWKMTDGTLVGEDGFTGALSRVSGESVAAYAIQRNTLTAGANYAVQFVSANLTITPAPLTVTADDVTKVYGQPNPAFAARYSGFVNGDGPPSLGGLLTFTTAANPMSNVDQYPVMPGGLTSTNYTIAFMAGRLTITPATPNVVVNGGSYVYDKNWHAASAAAIGVDNLPVNGTMTFTYNGSSTAPTAAGTYTVVASFASGNPNYTNATGTGSLVIEKAPQTITLSGVPGSVTLGEGPFTISATSTSGLPVSVTAAGACSLSGNVLSITGPGQCTVTAKQAGDSNYLAAPNVAPSFTTVVSWSNLLQPINTDGSSVFKYNSTIPVKFKLTGASAGVTNLGAKITLAKMSDQTTGNVVEAASTSAADFGNTFRYDASGAQYIFNLSTKLTGMSQGTWVIWVDLGDGVTHATIVSIKN